MNKLRAILRETSVGRFLIPIGIILIVFSAFIFNRINNIKNYVETEAIVSRTELNEEEYTDSLGNHYDATYTVFVKYNVDGIEYEKEFGVFMEYKVGDKVAISYNPKKPQQISQPTNIILPIILLLLGCIMLIGGTFSLIRAIKKINAMEIPEDSY